ncbi:MAG: alcohol dehydrogenase catalytic domain-containing protein [Halomonas sp.]|nr:alcohol dehydrogenase catalytic domain-containing protein [Halomonas sp.]MDZ7852643.1 alcohol dehydrogenase catalytic domain-containing protein [Halomonas sp.]
MRRRVGRLEFPFTLGHEWAGEVVGLGEGVTEFSVGDR